MQQIPLNRFRVGGHLKERGKMNNYNMQYHNTDRMYGPVPEQRGWLDQ